MTLMATRAVHVPVMTREVLEGLAVRAGGRYVDGTVGGGGHAEMIMDVASPGGSLLGLDLDPNALDVARRRLERFDGSVRLLEANYADMDRICRDLGFAPVHGILLDLGLSSMQLAEPRGFSFRQDAPLDMRFSPTGEQTAADIVNEASEDELADILWRYGEETQARRIARRIIQARPVRTASQLAQAVEQAVGSTRRAGSGIHPATRTFQALRIAVNRELQNLAAALPRAHGLLGVGGRLVVISYHSLEDRIVKDFIRRESRDCICPPGLPTCICGHRATLHPVNRKAVRPGDSEVDTNPSARSARLRAAERIAESAETA